MTAQEYFGDWWKVIPKSELDKVLAALNGINGSSICPEPSRIFRAFAETPFLKCKLVFLGQDPYPQKGVATGLCFANNRETNALSPSLEILRDCCINPEVPHGCIDFDVTLESWAKQGVLLLNSALTCEVNKIGSHVMLWRPFISKFLYTLSRYVPGLIYVLFGKQAQTFKPYINKFDSIIEVDHPSFFARTGNNMPYTVFKDIDRLMFEKYKEKIKWFNEIN